MALTVKQLRQSIVAISIKKYGWDLDQFHDLMADWGFGNSLRELNYPQLINLKNKLVNISDSTPFSEFDDQGRYMWSIAKRVWPQKTMKRLQFFWIKHFQKSHWNILSEQQRRGTIIMLKRYENGS